VPPATKASPRPRASAPARARTPSTATPPPRRSGSPRASLIAPQTRPRPPVRTAGATGATTGRSAPATTGRSAPASPTLPTRRRPPVEVPRRATRPEQRHPPGAARPGARRRLVAVIVSAVALVLTLVGFHAVLAQNQVQVDRVRQEITVAESRYDQARLENSELSSPARITQRALELGLGVPQGAPVAVQVPGTVPKRGTSSDVMKDWSEVKGNLDTSP